MTPALVLTFWDVLLVTLVCVVASMLIARCVRKLSGADKPKPFSTSPPGDGGGGTKDD